MTSIVDSASVGLGDRGELRADAEALVQTYGNSVSTGLFEPSVEMFQIPGLEGAVGYRRALGCAVALGDPVCPPSNRVVLADAFRAHCRARGLDTVYTIASESFAELCRTRGGAVLEFGYEHVLDPQADVLAGSAQQRLRGKVRRAARDGVEVREYVRSAGRNPAIERAMTVAVKAWRDARRGLQIYLDDVRLFEAAPLRRWFCAWRGDAVVGVLMMTRLDAPDGYVINQLLSTPMAPPGTTELLAVRALQTLGSEGCPFATFGAVASTTLGRVDGLSARDERRVRWIFRTSARVFHLGDREMYRHKFPAVAKPPLHLVFDPPRAGLRQALGVMRAFHASLA